MRKGFYSRNNGLGGGIDGIYYRLNLPGKIDGQSGDHTSGSLIAAEIVPGGWGAERIIRALLKCRRDLCRSSHVVS